MASSCFGKGLEYFFKFCFDGGVRRSGDLISAIVDFITKRCGRLLTDRYKNVYKLFQFRGSFRTKYEGDGIGKFLNLSLHNFLLPRILFDV